MSFCHQCVCWAKFACTDLFIQFFYMFFFVRIFVCFEFGRLQVNSVFSSTVHGDFVRRVSAVLRSGKRFIDMEVLKGNGGDNNVVQHADVW